MPAGSCCPTSGCWRPTPATTCSPRASRPTRRRAWREPYGSAHIAFAAKDRSAVNAFHTAAVPAGGKDNGGPGLRPDYHATYYAAFVTDPDGNNVEAVCHEAQ